VTMTYGVPGYISADGEFTTSNQRFSSSNAVIFADFDNDRWPDLLVTNKVGAPPDRDMLYMNRGSSGDGTWLGFDLVTYDLVPTFGGRTGGAMGVDVGDPDLDGDLDIYITDWSNLGNQGRGRNDLWVNQLAETGQLSFVHSDEMPALYSWGTQWQDFDNNGSQDLHVACEDPAPDFLYMFYPAGSSEEAEVAGVAQQGNARGDLTADYNRDGWTDLLVVIRSGPSILYENRSFQVAPRRNFLVVKLLGDP